MTCRHAPGDPNCSSHPDNPNNPANIRRRKAETPDKCKFEIVDIHRIKDDVVLSVRYPNCALCSYEGTKIMVFLGVKEADIVKWREIDPHFRDPDKRRLPTEAPPPVARFPANDQGWKDAINYLKTRSLKDL